MEEHDKQASKIKCSVNIAVLVLSLLLLACYICTYFAGSVHLFELLRNFIVQYMIIAFVLGVTAALLKKRLNMILMFALTLMCFIESRLPLNTPWQFFAQQEESSLTIASYNQNFLNENYDAMADWLKSEGKDFDAVIIIEATVRTKRVANRVKELFPYQITKHTVNPKKKPISYFILSKHKIEEHERIKLELSEKYRKNFFAKFKIKPESAKEPYTVYVVHTHSPAKALPEKLRNKELEQIAQHIQGDTSKNLIVMGDFNITPYSKHFKAFKETSGLNFQSYGLLLNPSWPAPFKLPLLQIPIDHVLYSDNLKQQNKIIGASTFSDHHALIAQFSEKQE